MKKYVASINGEDWDWNGFSDTFESVTDCLAFIKSEIEFALKNDFGIEYVDDEDRTAIDSVFIGEIDPYTPVVDAELVVDRLVDESYESCGEFAIGFLSRVTDEQTNELSNLLTDVYNEWSKKHSLEPNFWNVINIVHYNLDGSVVIEK